MIQGNGIPEFTWPQIISMGIRLLLMGLNVDTTIDRVQTDSGNSAIQVIQLDILHIGILHQTDTSVQLAADSPTVDSISNYETLKICTRILTGLTGLSPVRIKKF